MNIVKEYKGHTVPDEATHYYDSDFNGLSFYKMRKGEVYSCDDHADDWVFCADGGFFSYATKLPLATEIDWDSAPSDQLLKNKAAVDWVDGLPPVKMVCEVKNKNDNKWTKCVVVCTHQDHVWLDFDNRNQIMLIEILDFRPIKTREEKEREVLLDIIKGHQPKIGAQALTNVEFYEVLDIYAENIINTFDIIPKGDK